MVQESDQLFCVRPLHTAPVSTLFASLDASRDIQVLTNSISVVHRVLAKMQDGRKGQNIYAFFLCRLADGAPLDDFPARKGAFAEATTPKASVIDF
jgi:hypothetical protein